jgi:hypothetical protein
MGRSTDADLIWHETGGYTRQRIRTFCANISVSKTNGIVQMSLLEHYLRDASQQTLLCESWRSSIHCVSCIDNLPG